MSSHLQEGQRSVRNISWEPAQAVLAPQDLPLPSHCLQGAQKQVGPEGGDTAEVWVAQR